MKKNQTQEIIAKNNLYKDDDSGKMFLAVLLVPFIFSFIFTYILSSIADANEVKIESYTSQLWYGIVSILLQVVVIVGTFFIYNKIKNISIKAVKFTTKMPWKTYLILIAIGVVTLLGLQYFIGIFDNILKAVGYPLEEGLMLIEPDCWWKYLIAVVLLGVIPAIYEELIFRGVILQGLRSRFNDVVSVLLSAVMFMLMHASLQQFVYPFILGCVMGWVVLRTGSLLSSMIVHFVNNLLVITFSYIKHATSFSFALPDVWWFYLLAIALALITGAISYLVDRFYFQHKSSETVEKTSVKTSLSVYISLAVAAFLFLLVNVTNIVMG